MFPRRFTNVLKVMREAGLSPDDSCARLRLNGASIVECIVAQKEATGCDLAAAKRIVHGSSAWRDVAQATESMWDELIAELEKDSPNKSPEPTPGSVTPAGSAPAAPPPSAAQLQPFCRETSILKKKLAQLRKLIAPDGVIWVSWPKRASGAETDITEDAVRACALPLGLVDIKVCAVDEVWSGLKLLVRMTER